MWYQRSYERSHQRSLWLAFLLVHACYTLVESGEDYNDNIRTYKCCKQEASGSGNGDNWCHTKSTDGGPIGLGWHHLICCGLQATTVPFDEKGHGRGTWLKDVAGQGANGYLFSGVNRWLGCYTCTPGKFSEWYRDHPWNGQFICQLCGAGKYSAAGANQCTECPAGKSNNVVESSSCDECAAGKNQPATGQTSCPVCGAGKYSSWAGWGSCGDCPAGKYKEAAGVNTFCDECPAGKFKAAQGVNTFCDECPAGKYKAAAGVNVACDNCKEGTSARYAGQLSCTNCDAGTYQNAQLGTICKNCAAGKFSITPVSPFTSLNVQCSDCEKNSYSSGEGSTACSQCATGKWSDKGKPTCSSCEDTTYMNENFTMSVTAIACLGCVPCARGTGQLARCWPNTTSPGVCTICEAGTRLVVKTGVCEPCPANEYSEYNATRDDQTQCEPCPALSTAPVAGTRVWSGDNVVEVPLSNSIEACKCNEGFVKQYLDQTKKRFVCGCEYGKYVLGTKCVKCESCNHGEYRRGCELGQAGECVRCNFEQCVADQSLAGCGGLHAGKCKTTTDLVRTPLCPVKQDFSSLESRSAGFGSYDFTSIFKAEPEVLDFRCSEICDGRKTFNSVECDGPYACNMATCAEDVTEEGNMVPVRACPVVITIADSENIKQDKRKETCVSCSKCGHNNDQGPIMYDDWGAGCARECSQLLCDAGMVWDWTRKRCSTCEALTDERLCNKRDLSDSEVSVTGNLPLLFFEDCIGAGGNLQEISYGACKRCDSNYNNLACFGNNFPADCQSAGSVLCKQCSRATQSLYIDVLQGRWLDTEQLLHTHCQISACKSRNPNPSLQWTGVESSGKLCRKLCEPKVCGEDEILVPCRLPQQARCEPFFPLMQSVQPSRRAHTFHAGGEVNLLNEAMNEANALHFRRVASFENILIVTSSTLQYQCVWNADGIIDNVATPAGISHVMWAPMQTADDLYKVRGTRACRVLKFDVEETEMPLLPLQNTVACSTQEDADTQCLDRYMLVNTEAYGLSYHFDGDFGLLPTTSGILPFKIVAPDDDGLLSGEHVGASGGVFLMLRVHASHAKLAANVPNDRGLHNSTSWLRSVFLSFAVIDFSDHLMKPVTVTPAITSNGQSISDAGESQIPEEIWSQSNPIHDAIYDAIHDPVFAIDLYDFAGDKACDEDISSLAYIDIAPWNDFAMTDYAWVAERRNSAMLFEVSLSCLWADPDNRNPAECTELSDVAEVFVLLREYNYSLSKSNSKSNNQEAVPGCFDSFCINTQHKTLLSLSKIQQHIPGAPVADRLTKRGAALVKFTLQNNSAISLFQAQALASYSRCAVLITTTLKNVGLETEQSIMCFGADGVQTVKTQLYGMKFWGSFVSVIQNTSILLLLIGDISAQQKSLRWQYFDEHNSSVVDTRNIQVSSWLSVAVLADIITAVYWDNNELRLGLYHLRWDSDTLVLDDQTTSVSLGDDWENLKAWKEYSRVIVSSETNNILVALVEEAYSEEQLPTKMLFLRVCICTQHVRRCEKLMLDNIAVLSVPSFISAAYVEQGEMWVVGILGQIYSVQDDPDAESILLKHVPSTDLQHQHFVKVDNLFYCFRAGSLGESIEQSVLTYLPHYQRLRTFTVANLPAVYSVIVIPSMDSQNVQSLSTVTLSTNGNTENGNKEEPSTNSSLSNDNMAVLTKVLRLQVYWASYVVHSEGFPAKPLYERTGSSLFGTPSPHTQNARAQSPFSLLPRYTVSRHNITLNRALGLPFAYGRYQRIGTECIFQHHRTEERNRTSKPSPCLEKIHVDLTVSGSECNEDSVINGIYTYNNLSESTPVYVKQGFKIQRYMYYSSNGWRISRVLTEVHDPRQTKLLWPLLSPTEAPPTLTTATEYCKTDDPSNAYEYLNLEIVWKLYRPITSKIQVTLTPRCCAAGQKMASGVCINCTAGEYSEQGWNDCTACTPGKFSSSVGSSSCEHCVAGKYSTKFGAVACLDCPISSLCAVIQQKPGITLHHTRNSSGWITLLFSVPCSSLLQPFNSRGVYKEACEDALALTTAQEVICADHNMVVIVLDAEGFQNTTMHFFDQGNYSIVNNIQSRCIFMQMGVFLQDASMHNDKPTNTTINNLLRRNIFDKSPSLLPRGKWERQHHVLTLTPRENMLVELLFKHDNNDGDVAVGVDDVQLFPVLSDSTKVAHQSLFFPNGGVCASIHVPSQQQLSILGLAHLVTGNESIDQDNWERLHVTIGIKASDDAVHCQFTASLFYISEKPHDAEVCTEEISEEGHKIQQLGCLLTPSSKHVRGSYAQCSVELPAFLVGAKNLAVAVRSLTSVLNDTISKQHMCALEHEAEIVVSLRPHTQVYSCPDAEFIDIVGICSSCHYNTSICPVGERLRGCPALEPVSLDNCVECLEGRDFVNSGVAVYTKRDNNPCYWTCNVSFFEFQMDGIRSCRKCSPHVVDCPSGKLWKECSHTHDAGCHECPDIRLSSGPYGINEQFLHVDNTNKSNTCQTECKPGSYRSYDGFCKQCWDRRKLVLNAGPGFFFFKSCTLSSNSQAFPCIQREGEEIISSDSGEGTSENPFTQECVTRCLAGWYRHNNQCVKCTSLRQVVNGMLTTTSLPNDAFAWASNASSPCQFQCMHPYTLAGHGAPVPTCVLCTCPIGAYPRGPYCNCAQCIM